jgi:hypothetical protein
VFCSQVHVKRMEQVVHAQQGLQEVDVHHVKLIIGVQHANIVRKRPHVRIVVNVPVRVLVNVIQPILSGLDQVSSLFSIFPRHRFTVGSIHFGDYPSLLVGHRLCYMFRQLLWIHL